MLTVPQQIALNRWDTLPDNIREVLVSEHSVEILDRIAKDEHIPEDKITEISRVAGYVLMGFLHPEEVSKEIQEALKIDGKIAESISKSLFSRLFSPYKDQIEKLYAPAFESTNPTPRGPVMIAEDADLAQKKTVAEKPTAPQWKPPVAPQPAQTGGVPRPKTMGELGGQELGNLGSSRMAVKEVEPPKPAPLFKPAAPNAPARPVVGGIKLPAETLKFSGEGPLGIVEEIKKLERSGAELVDVLKKKESATIPISTPQSPLPPKSPATPPFQAPRPPVVEKPSATPSQPTGPVMIHQESDQEPIRPMSSFHLEPPPSQFSSPVSKNESRPVARVEFGGEKQLPDVLAKTDVIKPPRVVHYNTFQTPLENPPGVSAPKAPSFLPPSPVVKPEMPIPNPIRAQMPVAPSSPQMPTPQRNQGPQKIVTVNYGTDSMPPEGGPTNLNSMFSKPEEKHSSWLKSIFSKKSETPSKGAPFVPPAPPLPRPPQPRTTPEIAPRPVITPQPVPQSPLIPTPQKTFDIKAKEVLFEPKETNPPKFSEEKLKRASLPSSEEMIDLSALKKVE